MLGRPELGSTEMEMGIQMEIGNILNAQKKDVSVSECKKESKQPERYEVSSTTLQCPKKTDSPNTSKVTKSSCCGMVA